LQGNKHQSRITNELQMSYNSTIKQKIDVCLDCPATSRPQPLIAGRCKSHYWAHRHGLKVANDQAAGLGRVPDYRARTGLKTNRIEGLSDWYEQRRTEMTGICVETGLPSCATNDAFFIFSIAHILPKEHFPSIATHPLNWMELSIEAHTRYDRNWMTATKMKCFALAKEKFKKFEPFIAQEERRRIPPQFLKP
jgi:hypothetical protein